LTLKRYSWHILNIQNLSGKGSRSLGLSEEICEEILGFCPLEGENGNSVVIRLEEVHGGEGNSIVFETAGALRCQTVILW
jgi:hypothetical protein